MSANPPTGKNLLDQASRDKLMKIREGEQMGVDAIASVKLFTPDSSWTWYLSEFDGVDYLFGLVIGFEIEFGYVLLSELESVKGPLGLPIERDLYYSPKPFRELLEKHRKERG